MKISKIYVSFVSGTIQDCIRQAKLLISQEETIVIFTFNGVNVKVDIRTPDCTLELKYEKDLETKNMVRWL